MSGIQWLQRAGLVILLAGLFTKIDTVELYAEEPRRAIVALEMEMSGQYIVPTIHGENYYNKPPLYNWILLGFARVMGGFSEWSVRLPGLISFVLLAFCLFRVTKKYVNREVAILAGFGLLANPDLLFYATNVAGEIDLFFSLLVFIQVFIFFHFLEKDEPLRAFILSYFITAMGVLTKGLPALAFQGLTIMGWLLATGQWKKVFSWQHVVGGLAFLIPTGLYLNAYSQQGELQPFLVNLFMESSQRTPIEESIGKTLSGLVRFPFDLSLTLLPFSLLLIPLSWKMPSIKCALKNNRFLMFSLLFVIFNIWIYWISPGTHKRYLYPFFPFMYVLLAYGYYRLLKNNIFKKWSDGLVLLFIAAFILVSCYLPFHQDFQNISYFLLFSTLSILVGVVLVRIWFKIQHRIWLLFIVFGFLRLNHNFLVKPAIAEHSLVRVYRKEIQEITNQTKEPIIFLGKRSTDINRAFGVSDTIYVHKHMPYAIPFYYSLYSGNTLHIEENVAPGKVFLTQSMIPTNLPIDTLYQFRRKGHQPWVVFKVKD